MYDRGSFFLICSWFVMLWEVTGYRRADPVRHYETEDLDLFIVQIYYNYAKVQLKGGSTKKKVLFIMIESNHGNYGTIGIWKFFPLYHN